MGPLRNLSLPPRNPKLKSRQLLTIDRLGPNKDNRDETCDQIESAALQALEKRVFDNMTHCGGEEDPGCNMY